MCTKWFLLKSEDSVKMELLSGEEDVFGAEQYKLHGLMQTWCILMQKHMT